MYTPAVNSRALATKNTSQMGGAPQGGGKRPELRAGFGLHLVALLVDRKSPLLLRRVDPLVPFFFL